MRRPTLRLTRVRLAMAAAMLGASALCAQAAQQAAAPPSPVAAAPVAPPVAKGPTLYTVELVVFRSTGAGNAAGEDLTAQSSRSLSSDSDSAAAAPDTTSSVRLGQKLPAARFRMNDVEARLNSSGGWRSVTHVAWTQTASPWGSRSGLSAAQLGLDAAGIDGAVYLERGQYLHLSINLTVAGNAGTYTLAETRRVKLNERNYYDHPVYGVIAMVSPASAAVAASN